VERVFPGEATTAQTLADVGCWPGVWWRPRRRRILDGGPRL